MLPPNSSMPLQFLNIECKRRRNAMVKKCVEASPKADEMVARIALFDFLGGVL